MKNGKDHTEEEYVFEFYEDMEQNFEAEASSMPNKYNDVKFEENLNDEQLKIINNIKGPMLIIAGAGSGKTRTITYAVAKLLTSGVHPNEIMLVTFTNKAAKEMIKRVELLLGKRPKGIWAGTFHSMANRFIRRYSQTLGLKPNYNIMDETDARALMRLAMDKVGVSEMEERFPTSKMAKNILSYSINCDKTIREVILWKYSDFDDDKIEKKLKKAYTRYEKKKEEDGLLDFDDLLLFWNRLLDEKIVARMIARKIKYILVDEYQDTNHIQAEIIHKIARLNPERNIMVVGDDAQSIYAFRGANFKNILDFEDMYKDCKKYKITYNYRSVPEILTLANDSIRHNQFQHQKEMKPTRPSGAQPFLVNVADGEEQAKFIANQILRLREEGYKLNQIAILCRAGRHSLKIEQELQARNIPYVVRAGVGFFEKAHIKDALVHLRIIENPFDEIAWSRIFKMIPDLGKTSGAKIFSKISQSEAPLEKLFEKGFFSITMKGERIPSKGSRNLLNHITSLRNFSSNDNPSEILNEINKLIKDYIKSTYENSDERLEDLKELAIYSQNYATVQQFLETLSLNRNNIESKTVLAGNKSEIEEPVVISTIHRAKGLEWRAVFIPMLCQNFFPSSRVKGDQEAIEEERRVFYVAITRAKDQLYLISPALLQSWRGYQTADLSLFVEELDPKVYRKSSVKIKPKPNKESGFCTADELLEGK
ncbi:MAG: DNA helicase [Promethearchaeota archaeon]|nr:MAG: DNA helicase [Candidatus Lokiarchaeota archaeon]